MNQNTAYRWGFSCIMCTFFYRFIVPGITTSTSCDDIYSLKQTQREVLPQHSEEGFNKRPLRGSMYLPTPIILPSAVCRVSLAAAHEPSIDLCIFPAAPPAEVLYFWLCAGASPRLCSNVQTKPNRRHDSFPIYTQGRKARQIHI